MGGQYPEDRPQSRSKTADGGSNRTKPRQAASSPPVQAEKQPASRMPAEPPTPHRDEAACPQQLPARAELPAQAAVKQSQGQALGVKGVGTPLEQAELAGSHAAQQTAEARKQKAARRKAAKTKGAKLHTKPSASNEGQSTPDSSSQKGQHEQVAAAEVPAVGGPCSDAGPQGRSEVAHGGRHRTKARQAAPSPATSQRSSLQAACLLRLPLLTEMRQAALSSRQHMQSCHCRLLLSRAKARLLMTRVSVPPGAGRTRRVTGSAADSSGQEAESSKAQGSQDQGCQPADQAQRKQ